MIIISTKMWLTSHTTFFYMHKMSISFADMCNITCQWSYTLMLNLHQFNFVLNFSERFCLICHQQIDNMELEHNWQPMVCIIMSLHHHRTLVAWGNYTRRAVLYGQLCMNLNTYLVNTINWTDRVSYITRRIFSMQFFPWLNIPAYWQQTVLKGECPVTICHCSYLWRCRRVIL